MKEQELAKTIYVLIDNVKNNDKAVRGIIAEEIGRILIDAKEKNIHIKTLYKLIYLYCQDLEKESEKIVRENKKTIYGIDIEHLGC